MIFLAKNLKYLRKKHKHQQEDLANMLHVKANTISNYERGISCPDYETLGKLVRHFDITAQELLFENLPESDLGISSNTKSRLLSKAQICEICNEKDKRITEIKERINEQSDIIHYFIKKEKDEKKN